MGLDMYLYKTKKFNSQKAFYENYYDEEKFDKDNYYEDIIFYWRKHSDLHGLMEEMYHSRLEEIKEYIKAEDKECFNCIPLVITKEDVIEIIELHENNEIPEARGFFWGASREEDFKESLEQFKELLEETDWDNETVFYNSWW